MKDIFSVFKEKRWIARMVIAGVLFLACAAPFRMMLSLVPGMTEVRPANMIPVVFGILWGPAAAWGISIANAISDILVSHSPVQVWLPGFFINFFYAYLPYKMWYSIDYKRNGIVKPRLGKVYDILKFIWICFVDSLVTTVLLALLFEYLGFQSYSSSAVLLFFNNFDFAVVLGIPVILVFTSRREAKFWIPPMRVMEEQDEKAASNYKLFTLFDLLLFLVAASGVVYYLYSKITGFVIEKNAELVILVAFLFVEILYIRRPFGIYRKTRFRVNIREMSIRAKVVLGFLMVSVVCVLLIGCNSYFTLRPHFESQKQLWEYIYIVVGFSLNVLFVVSILFLRYVEKKITNPLELLAEQVKDFAKRDHQKDGMEERKDLQENLKGIKTGDEIEGLSDSFCQMMDDITSYVTNLARVTAEKERIGAELNVATQIQADMLPSIFPAFPDREEIGIYATMTPAKEVGGDFYDFFMVDDRHLAMVMADVSGKGVPAALFMVIGKTLIKDHTKPGMSLGEVFTEVNNLLCESNKEGLFITAFEAVLDLVTGELVFVNAGHELPFIQKKDGQYETYKTRAGFVLAGMEGIRYRQGSLQMEPGDKLFLYTDGVPEATDANEQLYGMERLEKILNENKEKIPEELLPAIKEDIDEFVGAAPQFDDITMLCMEYRCAMTKQSLEEEADK